MDNTTPTSLYRYYDSGDALIYVGITSRGMGRNVEHDKSKDWWQYVKRQEVDHFHRRADALAAEKLTIMRFRPAFNRQHNPDHEELRRTYLQMQTLVGTTGMTVVDTAHEMILQGNKFSLDVKAVRGGVVYLHPSHDDLSIVDFTWNDPKFSIGSGGRKAKLLSASQLSDGPEVRMLTRNASECIGAQLMTKRSGTRVVMKRIDLAFRDARMLG